MDIQDAKVPWISCIFRLFFEFADSVLNSNIEYLVGISCGKISTVRAKGLNEGSPAAAVTRLGRVTAAPAILVCSLPHPSSGNFPFEPFLDRTLSQICRDFDWFSNPLAWIGLGESVLCCAVCPEPSFWIILGQFGLISNIFESVWPESSWTAWPGHSSIVLVRASPFFLEIFN